MAKFKVFWTKQATNDLEETIAYIANDSLKTAVSIYKKIKLSCSKLSNNPERNRIIPELNNLGIISYREIIIKPYRIIYKIEKSNIYIIAAIDSRRDFESFLFSRLINDN